MIPLWKLQREIKRVLRQILLFPYSLVAGVLSTPYYDFILARKRTIFKGRLPERDKIAIFVIFPRNGIAISHLRTIEHLYEKGYAALVVSNLPLSTAERDKVLARCWQLIERPNYGYDFGGYRDGVLSIADRLVRLQRLVFLNDSCWFPLPDSDDWLGKAEALTDFVGAAANYAEGRPNFGEFDQFVWNSDTDRGAFHYTSFALSLSNRIVSDPRFYIFWKRFRLSNKKSDNIRHGEVGLTQWALNNDFSHTAVYDVRRLDEELRVMPLDALSHLVERLVVCSEPRLRAWKNENLRSMRAIGIDRDRLEKIVLVVVAHQGMSYALVDYLISKHRFPFLKKSPLWLSNETSQISLEIIAEMGVKARQILTEAKELIPDNL